MLKTKRTIRKIYLYKALVDFILLYPLYNIMFASHGLTTFEISTLLIIWSVTDIVTNVPMGVLADRFSRKKLLALAPLVEALGFATWFVWPTYGGFALGLVLWGIGGAIFDGTYEALLYDELKSAGIERQYVKIAGRAQSFGLVANFAATALAGAAILLGFGFVIWGSVAALLLASLVAMTFPAAQRFEEVADTRYFVMLRQGIHEAFHNRVLLEVILLGGFIGAIYGSLEEFEPLFFRQVGYTNTVVSLIEASTVLAAAVASLVAYRYEKLTTSRFMLLFALSGILLLATGIFPGVSSIFLLVLYAFLIRSLGTIYEGKVQHSITSHLRATVTSVSLFALELMAVVTYFVYGLLSSLAGGNFTAFRVVGLSVIVIALCYAVISPRLLAKTSLRQAEK